VKKPEAKPDGKSAEGKDAKAKGEGKADAKSTQKGDGASASKTPAKANNPFADDLLADLNSSNSTHKPNAKTTQAGAAGGTPGGGASGAKSSNGEYISQVVARVRPHVQVPDNVSGNPKAVVEVTLLPSLEVRDVKLLQSSGNPAYDEAVQRAVWAAKTFPPLPPGAQFADFRRLKLEFRPR
jgi:colicin import membrane protein